MGPTGGSVVPEAMPLGTSVGTHRASAELTKCRRLRS